MSKTLSYCDARAGERDPLEGIPAPTKGRKESTPIAQAGPQMTDQISVLVPETLSKAG